MMILDDEYMESPSVTFRDTVAEYGFVSYK
jgi:hypothetical protein